MRPPASSQRSLPSKRFQQRSLASTPPTQTCRPSATAWPLQPVPFQMRGEPSFQVVAKVPSSAAQRSVGVAESGPVPPRLRIAFPRKQEMLVVASGAPAAAANRGAPAANAPAAINEALMNARRVVISIPPRDSRWPRRSISLPVPPERQPSGPPPILEIRRGLQALSGRREEAGGENQERSPLVAFARRIAAADEPFLREPLSDIAINAVVKNGLNPAVSRPAWVKQHDGIGLVGEHNLWRSIERGINRELRRNRSRWSPHVVWRSHHMHQV